MAGHDASVPVHGMNQSSERAVGRGPMILVCAILVIAALYWGRELLIPFALAAFLCFLLAPVVHAVERLRVGRVVAVFFTASLSFALLGGIGWVVASQAADLVRDLPNYSNNIAAKIHHLRTSVAGAVDEASKVAQQFSDDLARPSAATAPATQRAVSGAPDAATRQARPTTNRPARGPATKAPGGDKHEPVKVEVVAPTLQTIALLGRIITPAVHPLATAGVTTILVVFLLVYREDLRDRVVCLCGQANIQVTTAALVDCANRVTRFMAAQAFTNGISGLVTGVGLFVLGIPNAALWGLLTAVCRFAPYIGSFVAAFFPVALAVALFDGWRIPLIVLGWCALVDLVSANLLEPWLYGVKTGVAPTAILLAFIFWTWLWGGIGLLLATPITVCLVVLGKHIPAFEVFSILLSDQSVLEPKTRFYQRILSMDAKEAAMVVRRYRGQASLVETYDHVLLPALAQLEYDRRAGLLDSMRVDFARRTAEELIGELDAPSARDKQEPEGPPLPPPRIALACDPGAFDDLLPQLLKQVTRDLPIRLMELPSASLTAELLQDVRALRPEGIVFAAIQPRDAGRVRHICERLQSDHWSRPLHVVWFTVSPQEAAAHRRALRNEAIQHHSTLAELLDGLRRSFLSPVPSLSEPAEPLAGRPSQAWI